MGLWLVPWGCQVLGWTVESCLFGEGVAAPEDCLMVCNRMMLRAAQTETAKSRIVAMHQMSARSSAGW